MGIPIEKDQFSPEEFTRFSQRLDDCLVTLKEMLADPGFGGNTQSWGAELELYLIDENGVVVHCNQELIAEASNPLITPELNRYNIEYNSSPVIDHTDPLTQLHKEIKNALQDIDAVAKHHGARQAAIGILPTLTPNDFGLQNMTDIPRYRALMQQLKHSGTGEFQIHIDGTPPFKHSASDVTFEGANTSYQVHYRVAPHRFADLYNALLLATPVVLSVSGNSPTLLGHRLWQETRIPLFKHSIDYRQTNADWRQPSRVSFGYGFLRKSAFELFAETVALHPPLLPVSSEDNYLGQWQSGTTPKLDELRLHQNSVWSWLRPVYDYHDEGHLRIELRALAAGPTVSDMIANTAFYVGLGEGIANRIDDFLSGMTFNYTKYNFYRSAQLGTQARLVWPSRKHRLEERDSLALAKELLPLSREGLEFINMDKRAIDFYLNIIEERIETGQTGSTWQLEQIGKLTNDWPAPLPALGEMLALYLQHQDADKPVSQWTGL